MTQTDYHTSDPSLQSSGNRLSSVLVFGLAFAVSVLLLLNLGTQPLGRDQATFSVIGFGMLEGRAPYSDAWDIKTPGIFFIYSLAHAIFGSGELAPRGLEIIAMVLMAVGYFKLTEGLVDIRAAAISFVIALYSMTIFGFWHTGQPETYGAVILVWAVLATQQRWYIAAGALYAFAIFLKPSFGGGVLPSLAYALCMIPKDQRGAAEILRVIAKFAAGGFAVLAAVIGYLWAVGALQAFAWTMFSFLPNYLGNVKVSDSRSLVYDSAKTLVRFCYAWPAIIFGVGVGVIFAVRSRALLWTTLHLLAVAAFPLIGVALQGKFFPYHYLAALGPMALIAGWGIWLCATTDAMNRIIRGAVVVLFGLLLVLPKPDQRFLKTSADRVAMTFLSADEQKQQHAKLFSTGSFDRAATLGVVDWINSNLAEDASVYVWGFDPSIYLLSHRNPPTRFISNFPQRVTWSSDSSRDELMQSLKQSPPNAIIVSKTDVMRAVTGNLMDSGTVLEQNFDSLRQFIKDRYMLSTRVGSFDIYKILEDPN